MSIVARFENDLDGSWTTTPAFTQPDVVELPKGLGRVSMTFRSTCADYNGGKFTASLQATTEGSTTTPPDGTSQWDDVGQTSLGADGALINRGSAGVGIDLSRYKFVRVVYSLDGGPPNADAALSTRLLGDYVS